LSKNCPKYCLYKSQKIKLKGYLEVTKGETSFLYSLRDYKNVNSKDYEMLPFISLRMSETIESENISLIKEIAEKNSMVGELGKVEKYRKQLQGVFLAEVEITGYVEEEKNEIFGGYYPAIRIEKLKQLSPVKFIYIEELKGEE
jgi:hypothetical protein